jgi:type II secretory ATPase GspE/PulE/Tfp pilus assembly ATPase PilB-like protein
MNILSRLTKKKPKAPAGASANDPFDGNVTEAADREYQSSPNADSPDKKSAGQVEIQEDRSDYEPNIDSDLISAYDPGSQKHVTISGNIITGPSGIAELKESMRQLLIASTDGQIYFSRSHQNDPHVLSEIKRIETIQGKPRIKHAIDMSTLGELYHRSSKRSTFRKAASPRNDQSAMQRALIAIVANAAAKNASDVHIIANQDRAITKFRVDGVMTYINEMQPQYAFELLSAAFAMADASDPAYQQRQYQAARISSLTTELPSGVQSLRLQFNPLANEGRYLIMRILYSGDGKRIDMEQLGYSPEQVRQIATMSARPVGINVISGPTGSGKSTTLKAILESVIERRASGGADVNTITIEDPPEYVIRAAQQMPVVNAKTQEERAEAFTQAISAGLRSDPDIMMIGEIRDLASADLAVEGALSGHPIYASLHANTAMDILSRLRDMGIDDFKVFDAEVFSGLVGQRLLRQICPHCRVKYDEAVESGRIDELLAERVEKMLAITPPRKDGNEHQLHVAGTGCEHCTGGYKGRTVVAEIILPDDTFMEFMRSAKKAEARTYWFENMNGIDLLGSSWIRALEGRVTPIDIENSVSLIDPVKAHEHALKYWCNKMGISE